MLLIIDNQSSYIKKFKRNFLSEQSFSYRFFDHNEAIRLSPKEKVKGLILSGGKGNPFEPLNLAADFVAMMNYNVPTMGICLGHEIIAAAYMGRIKRLEKYQNKQEKIFITQPEDPIFEGVSGSEILLKEKHSFHVSELPRDFISMAYSSICPNEVIRHKKKPIYGFQSHPEVSGKEGLRIMKNFFKLCGLEVS